MAEAPNFDHFKGAYFVVMALIQALWLHLLVALTDVTALLKGHPLFISDEILSSNNNENKWPTCFALEICPLRRHFKTASRISLVQHQMEPRAEVEEEEATNPLCFSRRGLFVSAFFGTLSSFPFQRNNNNVAHAACLSGDTSTECIGVYKLPVDATISKESLQTYAPDVTYIDPVAVPHSYKEAVTEVHSLKGKLETVQEFVAKGQLESAGQGLLEVLPRLTVCHQVLLDEYASSSDTSNKKKKSGEVPGGTVGLKVDALLSEAILNLNQCDILMGQGIRGDLGVLTVAQIQILEVMRDAMKDYDELLKVL